MREAIVVSGPFCGCLILPVRHAQGGIFALILDGDLAGRWEFLGAADIREVRGK